MTAKSIKPTIKPATFAAQAGGVIDGETGAVVPPIHVATTYIRDPDNAYSKGYVYGRPDNPTVRQTEHVIAGLEEAMHDQREMTVAEIQADCIRRPHAPRVGPLTRRGRTTLETVHERH